jgi:hypothetical protein
MEVTGLRTQADILPAALLVGSFIANSASSRTEDVTTFVPSLFYHAVGPPCCAQACMTENLQTFSGGVVGDPRVGMKILIAQ